MTSRKSNLIFCVANSIVLTTPRPSLLLFTQYCHYTHTHTRTHTYTPYIHIYRLKDLSRDDRIVYGVVKASGDKGIWIKDIRTKTNLAINSVDGSVKKLESKGIIKAVKTVRHPTRKYYMLTQYEPSEEVVGGVWYNGLELDTTLIEAVTEIIVRHIRSKVCSCLTHQNTKESTNQPTQINQTHNPSELLKSPSAPIYPSLDDIVTYINSSKVSKVNFTPGDMATVLDRLVYESKIIRFRSQIEFHNPMADEKVMDTDWCYRWNPTDNYEKNSVLKEIPCGQCPVFENCCEDGVISPATCTYYTRWLENII